MLCNEYKDFLVIMYQEKACYSFYKVKSNEHKETLKAYILMNLKLFELEQEKMNIQKDQSKGGPHNYTQFMDKAQDFHLKYH